jgi:ribosomal protein S1
MNSVPALPINFLMSNAAPNMPLCAFSGMFSPENVVFDSPKYQGKRMINDETMNMQEMAEVPGTEPTQAAAPEAAETEVQQVQAEPSGPHAHLEKLRIAKTIVGVAVKKWSRNGLEVELEDGTPAFMPNAQIDLDPDRNIANYFGKTIQARITRVKSKEDGTAEVSVSHRSVLEDDLRKAAKERLESIKTGDVIDAKVKAFNIKDVLVDLGPGVEAVIKGKDLTWEKFSHPYEIVKRGATIQAKVLQVDKKHRKVQLGVRQLSNDPYVEKFDAVHPDETVSVKVASINDFGAEVSLPNEIIAFLPISEISWERIPTVASVMNIGDEFETKVLTVDTKKRRITVSKKRTIDNPLRMKEEKYRLGTDHNGTIKEVNKGGVVILFEDGNEGFVPRRELSHDRIERLEDVFRKEKPLEGLRVIEYDRKSGKITLSLTAAEKEAQRTTLRQYRPTTKAASFGLADQLVGLKEKLKQEESNRG